MFGVRGKLLIGLLCAGASSVFGGTISPIVMRVEATNQDGTAVYEVPFDEGHYNRSTDTYSWSSADPIILRNEAGRRIGTIESCGTTIIGDPVVNLNFLFVAGASSTSFT